MDKIKGVVFLILFGLFIFFASSPVAAEVQIDSGRPDGGIIPKIPKTQNDPALLNGGVYPMWGPVCQRYTYYTTYQDKEGRAPEYVKMFFNGAWITPQKEDPKNSDYKNGVRYIYQFVPNKLGSNFFFFEASNGLGKARQGIIDSPGNGPVLFESDFLDNEIVLINAKTGKEVWRFPTKEEWVGGVALSDDGKYLAAQTSSHIYLFSFESNKPLWSYDTGGLGSIGGDVKGGVDISGNGQKIVAAIGNSFYLFDRSSNRPIWQKDMGGSAYGVAISKNGQYAAAGTAGSEENVNTNLLIYWKTDSSKPLWQYHASGNFHEVDVSDDGSYVVGATGCPDRRAYFFSKNSNQPLVRSEMLTTDSPVDEAQISGDGQTAAFGTESNQGSIAFFSKNSNQPLWRFNAPLNSSFRAVDITDNGKFLGGATFKGDIYLFAKNSASPLNHWHENASMGAFGLSDDGQTIVVGGANNKIHIYHQGAQTQVAEISLSEYVGEVAVSSNGKYAAAGTSGSVYFFETFTGNEGKIFPCTTIIEPKPLSQAIKPDNGIIETFNNQQSSPVKTSLLERILEFFRRFLPQSQKQSIIKSGDAKCGNNLCEPAKGESRSNCPQDCSGNLTN